MRKRRKVYQQLKKLQRLPLKKLYHRAMKVLEKTSRPICGEYLKQHLPMKNNDNETA